MAMKKAELEEHRDLYRGLLSQALAAEREGEHRVAAAIGPYEAVRKVETGALSP